MRRLIALLTTCLCACDGADPTLPVDMAYVAAVQELENTCGTEPAPDGTLAVVDAYLRADGTVELRHGSGWIPEPYMYPDIRIATDGRVDYKATRASEALGRSFDYAIKGSLTMDGMDLELRADWYRYDGGNVVDCVRRVRLKGPPRGYLDGQSIEGTYALRLSYFGEVCGLDPVPAVPLGSQVFLLSALPTESELRLSFDGLFWVWTGLPADGALSWSGTGYVSGPDGIEDVQMRFDGTFGPASVDLTFSFAALYQLPGCRYAYALEGAKRLASTVEASGDYRAVITFSDECAGGSGETYETPITLVGQSETEIEVRDPYGNWFIPFDGTTLEATDGSEDLGLIATFRGRAVPPDLGYVVTFSYETSAAVASSTSAIETDDGWCDVTWSVDAISRYFPDLEWDTEGTPEGASARALRASPPRPSILSTAELGPLTR